MECSDRVDVSEGKSGDSYGLLCHGHGRSRLPKLSTGVREMEARTAHTFWINIFDSTPGSYLFLDHPKRQSNTVGM